jgi:hypothetical protein
MSKAACALLGLVALSGAPALAQTHAQTRVPEQFAKFSVSPADLAQLDDGDDRVCTAQAKMMRNAEPGLRQCAYDQIDRLQVDVRFAYAGSLARQPLARRASFQRDQNNWEARYLRQCQDDLGIEGQPRGFREPWPLIDCEIQALYRRVIWLKRVQF